MSQSDLSSFIVQYWKFIRWPIIIKAMNASAEEIDADFCNKGRLEVVASCVELQIDIFTI